MANPFAEAAAVPTSALSAASCSTRFDPPLGVRYDFPMRNPAPSIALGLDIGGTKMALALVTEEGRILADTSLPTESALGFERALDRIATAAAKLQHSAGFATPSLLGIGIGCAGPVHPVRGTIHNPFTLPGWEDANIVSALRQRLGVPVFLENDADAAALGECFAGAGRGFDPVVMLTLGTGVGGAVVTGGQVFRGCDGEHPELGHVPVEPNGPSCYCGRAGCLESIASGTAIANAGRSAGFADSREVFGAAARGDQRAQAMLQRVAAALETATWTLLHAFLPQRIILGGGVAEEHFDLLVPGMRRAVAAATMAPRGRIEIVPALLGNQAGVIGAASLAHRRCA